MSKHLKAPLDFAGLSAQDIAISGAKKAASLIKPNGRFVYLYKGGQVLKGYNLMRHFGTAWAIADIAASCGGLAAEADAANCAMAWLSRKYAVPALRGFAISNNSKAKLGGAGLAILALTSLAGLGLGVERLGLARQLGEFILSCRKADGDFHHKVDVFTGKPYDFRSDYYTGEALFGLVRLYEATGEKRFLQAVRETIPLLDVQNYRVPEQSHWMVFPISFSPPGAPQGTRRIWWKNCPPHSGLPEIPLARPIGTFRKVADFTTGAPSPSHKRIIPKSKVSAKSTDDWKIAQRILPRSNS